MIEDLSSNVREGKILQLERTRDRSVDVILGRIVSSNISVAY